MRSPTRHALPILGVALVILAVACRPAVRTSPPAGEDSPPRPAEAPASEVVTLSGILDVIAPSGSSGERVSLVTGDGRVVLLLEPGQLAALGPAARMPGARASVRAVRVAAPEPTVRVVSISLLPALP